MKKWTKPYKTCLSQRIPHGYPSDSVLQVALVRSMQTAVQEKLTTSDMVLLNGKTIGKTIGKWWFNGIYYGL